MSCYDYEKKDEYLTGSFIGDMLSLLPGLCLLIPLIAFIVWIAYILIFY